MKIELSEITIKEIVDGYIDNKEEGVVGWNGKLNIRPKYQREFVYKGKQQEEVIETIKKDFPLNVMYWVGNQEKEGHYELLDGQQRTISICRYVEGKFAINYRFFHNLTPEEQEQILNYKLMVYLCEGSEREKLDWFKTINIAGEKLTSQELRNAIYTGTWLTDAKKYFSKTGCPAYEIASNYVKGVAIRQEYLETAIHWISHGNIEIYMSENQHKLNAKELWLYFQSVINWVKATFPNYRKEMKGVNYGFLFNEFKDKEFDSDEMEIETYKLMQDEDVTKKAGIYPYLITGEEKYLSVRSFTDNQKRESYQRQNGICAKCNNHFDIKNMEADHATPWSLGGRTVPENCQMLCMTCNRTKSNK